MKQSLFAGKGPFGIYDDDSGTCLSEDGSLDQTVPSLGSPSHSSPSSLPGVEHIERFSRKVFVGGLPPDIDEGNFLCVFLFSWNSIGQNIWFIL